MQIVLSAICFQMRFLSVDQGCFDPTRSSPKLEGQVYKFSKLVVAL